MAKELSLMGQLRKEADRDFSKYLKYVNEIFEENKMLHEEQGRLHRLWSKDTKHIAELEEENKKLKDEFMLRLAEAYLLPPTSNQMAEYKKWDYSKWYDEIKNQMRKEIKEED